MKTIQLTIVIPAGATPEAITVLSSAASILRTATGLAQNDDSKRVVASNLCHALSTAAEQLRTESTTVASTMAAAL
jgi:hypothetical protein